MVRVSNVEDIKISNQEPTKYIYLSWLQVIVIVRLLLENKGDGNTENVPITGMTGIDSMITSLVRYCFHDNNLSN